MSLNTQSGLWMRPCPVCGKVLTKIDPDTAVKCPACEWIWQGWLPQRYKQPFPED